MRNRNAERALAVFFVFLVLSLILAGCSLTGTQGDPYSAGQKARTEFDKMSKEASDFVAGFCGASPLPAAAIGLVVVLQRTKKG